MGSIQVTPELISSIQRKLSLFGSKSPQRDSSHDFDLILETQVYQQIVSLTQRGQRGMRALFFSASENSIDANWRLNMVTDGTHVLSPNAILALQTFGTPTARPKNICLAEVQNGYVQRRFFVPQDDLLESCGLQMTFHYSEDNVRNSLSEMPLGSVKSEETIWARVRDFFSLDTLLGRSNQEISEEEKVILIHVALCGESRAGKMLNETDLPAAGLAQTLDSLVDRDYLYRRKVEYPVKGVTITQHYYGLTPEGIELVQKKCGVHFFSINPSLS